MLLPVLVQLHVDLFYLLLYVFWVLVLLLAPVGVSEGLDDRFALVLQNLLVLLDFLFEQAESLAFLLDFVEVKRAGVLELGDLAACHGGGGVGVLVLLVDELLTLLELYVHLILLFKPPSYSYTNTI